MENKTLYVCNGCCCGHPEKGNPVVKHELFRYLLAQEGLDQSVQFEVPYCLGPCSMANVVKVIIHGKTYWFRQVNTDAEIHAVINFLKNSKEIPNQLKSKQVFF